jgi:hypothetical protein
MLIALQSLMLTTGHSGFPCSIGSSAMLGGMALCAERDQILLGVLTGLTAKSLVVNFKVG